VLQFSSCGVVLLQRDVQMFDRLTEVKSNIHSQKYFNLFETTLLSSDMASGK